MRTDHRFPDVVSSAIDLASWWIKHSVPYGMLQEKQVDMLGKTSALTLPVVKRWGSHYSAMKALVSNERCMQLLVLEKREALRNSVGKKPGPRATADKMMDPCTDLGFWSGVKTVMKHIGPLLVKRVMLEGLETRFSAYDQPAMLIAYMLNPHRQTAFLNPLCSFVTTRNAVQLVEVLYLRFLPKEAEAQAETGIADQSIAYITEETPFYDITMRLASLPGALPERSWNLVKHEASQLSKLALCLMGVSVNAAGCDRSFSQMGLTHTKLRNRLGWAKTTHIAQLRQELHRDRPKRKRARVLTAVDSAHSAAAENSTPTEDSIDAKTLSITSSPKTGDNTYELVKQEIETTESVNKVPVIAVVSDAAGEAAKARRLLILWRPDILTLDSYSHQFNLSVGGKS
ncbi:hypothetical protein ABBQ38_008544 [Trebouxia sp. C0009 RCD-2024]